MSKKITLPSGATVTLKDPQNLRVKDRKRVLKSAETEGGDLSRALALGDALIAMLVEDWSFDLLIPSIKIDNLDELEMVRRLLNHFEKDLSSKEEGVPENAGIAIKTMYLFVTNKSGFEIWFTEIRDLIIEKIKENKKQTRH